MLFCAFFMTKSAEAPATLLTGYRNAAIPTVSLLAHKRDYDNATHYASIHLPAPEFELMAPFSKAVKVERAGDDGGVTIYKGEVDPTWSVGACVCLLLFCLVILKQYDYRSVPNGGSSPLKFQSMYRALISLRSRRLRACSHLGGLPSTPSAYRTPGRPPSLCALSEGIHARCL